MVVKCRQSKEGSPVYILDPSNPEYSIQVKYTPGTNIITVDRWAAMVAFDGDMLISINIGGMSSYTGHYFVSKDNPLGEIPRGLFLCSPQAPPSAPVWL